MASPYLHREARLIRLVRALGPTVNLADPAARRSAYARAGLGIVNASDDQDAFARARIHRELFAPPALGVAA